MDTMTANLIQAAVRVERDRCVSIILREALWLKNVASGQPSAERNPINREVQVLLDLVDEINKP